MKVYHWGIKLLYCCNQKLGCGTGEEQSEEIKQKIELLMAELTRLMDGLEGNGENNSGLVRRGNT